MREERKVLALALTSVGALLGATAGALYGYRRGTGTLHKVKSFRAGAEPGSAPWDLETLMSFYRNERPHLEPDVVMAPVRAGTDVVGVLALWRDRPFEAGAGKSATEILRIVGGMLGARRRISLLEAEASVARAMARGCAPRDVAYRIFHHLRRFLDYDHGATLVERIDDSNVGVVARQVAWAKGKSSIIGRQFWVAWPQLAGAAGTARILQGVDIASAPWTAVGALREEGSPAKRGSIIAVLEARGLPLGFVEVASSREAFFREGDAAVVEAFKPYLAWCLEGWLRPPSHDGQILRSS